MECPSSSPASKSCPVARKPALYRVLLFNDDYTPMAFVVDILEQIFVKTRKEATNIMLTIHRKGVGIGGLYSLEVAEMKMDAVLALAHAHEYPLKCIIEKEES